MKNGYLVAGISIINDIYYADGRISENNLGGCAIFAYGGIGLFTDNVTLISTGGQDFFDYYGNYFDENQIGKEGIYYDLPYTHHTALRYEVDGRWSERSIYGDDYFAKQSENNRTSFRKLEPFLSDQTKGLYLDSGADEGIFEEIDAIRNKAMNIKIMWEPPTFSTKNEIMHERILDNLSKTDYYSMNLDEASFFFKSKERKTVIRKIIELGIPCFLREGENGSSWIEKGKCISLKAYKPEKAIDVTGCGNCSAASALYWRIEGKDFEDIVLNANIAAGYNAAFKGPAPIRKGREEKIFQIMREYYH